MEMTEYQAAVMAMTLCRLKNQAQAMVEDIQILTTILDMVATTASQSTDVGGSDGRPDVRIDR
jgi:hypothetical protein